MQNLLGNAAHLYVQDFQMPEAIVIRSVNIFLKVTMIEEGVEPEIGNFRANLSSAVINTPRKHIV